MRTLLSLLCSVLLTGCSSLPFHPSKDLLGTPSAIGLTWGDVFIQTKDGETLHGWFVPGAEQGPGSGVTILFLHGNAGNISHRLDTLRIFHDLGADTLIIDYRGFGKSTGTPSVKGVRADAEAAWRMLLEDKHLRPDRIVIAGRSLGGAVAASLAEKTEPAGLIFESSFTTLQDVAHALYPMWPVSWFLPQDFDTVGSLHGKTSLPLLVIHSREDEVIPFTLGFQVYNTYPGPKEFVEISGSHNAGYLQNQTRYTAALGTFLKKIRHANATRMREQ